MARYCPSVLKLPLSASQSFFRVPSSAVHVVLAEKPMTKLEVMAKMRDMKRRRQSYRGKSTHTAKKNYTEVCFPFVDGADIVCTVFV